MDMYAVNKIQVGCQAAFASRLAPTVDRVNTPEGQGSKPEMPDHPLQLNPQLRQLDTRGRIALHRQ
jgi:hypothetical protein